MVRDVVRHMAAMPGQRVIILASPGFINPEDHTETGDVLDRAIRANVTINALDARGLYVDGMDMSRQVYDLDSSRVKAQYERDNSRASSDVLAELAYGTGGTFFQNNNDLAEGYRKIADVPEYYVPARVFAAEPQAGRQLSYAESSSADAGGSDGDRAARLLCAAPSQRPGGDGQRGMREAIFSREEMHEIPVELHSQFFKPSNEIGAFDGAGAGRSEGAQVSKIGRRPESRIDDDRRGDFRPQRQLHHRRSEAGHDAAQGRDDRGAGEHRHYRAEHIGRQTRRVPDPAGGAGCGRATHDGAERRREYSYRRPGWHFEARFLYCL